MVYGEWFFPVYFPYLLVLVKWMALMMAGQEIVLKGFVDIPFSALTFDLWAIVTKLQGRPLRPGTTITEKQSRREGTCVVATLVLHLLVYMFSVWALLGQESPLPRFLAALAMVGGALIPCFLLGSPSDQGE
jgi:hypothetical protein